MAIDPSSFVRDTVSSDESDSDGLDSEDEVKPVISQLDVSVEQLRTYTPILAAPVVSKVQGRADERMANQMTDGSEDQHQSLPRRSKRKQASASDRDAEPPRIIDSGEFWAEPVAPSISDFAETVEMTNVFGSTLARHVGTRALCLIRSTR